MRHLLWALQRRQTDVDVCAGAGDRKWDQERKKSVLVRMLGDREEEAGELGAETQGAACTAADTALDTVCCLQELGAVPSLGL